MTGRRREHSHDVENDKYAMYDRNDEPCSDDDDDDDDFTIKKQGRENVADKIKKKGERKCRRKKKCWWNLAYTRGSGFRRRARASERDSCFAHSEGSI